MPSRTTAIALLLYLFSLPILPADVYTVQAEDAPPAPKPGLPNRLPAFQDVAMEVAPQLSTLPGQGDALALFKEVIGPRLGLIDPAMTLGAKTLPPSMAKELLLDDLKQSAAELVRGLAAWQLAVAVRTLPDSATPEQLSTLQKQVEAQTPWFTAGTPPVEEPLKQLLSLTKDTAPQPPSLLGGHAAQLETWAIQTVHREWYRLAGWKDTVRQQRGLARLCGTWQWSIHNHQNHREEKTAVIFAPNGATSSTTPAEISVLGDNVYLRWETRAGVQEDSLLFSGEGQRLEGTFVNTAGGWGSITGKRTATCTGEGGDKPASAPRRHHH